MEDSHSFLVKWTIDFVKNKDIIAKKIERIENGKDGFDLYVKYNDKEQYFIIQPSISNLDDIAQKLNSNHHSTIITLNSKGNFDSLFKNWNKLVQFKFLSIIFINPFSSMDKKWIIFPHTHNKICDESSLQTGLKSMFETVDSIEEIQLMSKITG